MTDVIAWLESRRPPPPDALAASLRRIDASFPSPHQVLGDAGLDALGRARSAPGRERASAFHLLTADAFLTYACEAALEEADPEPHLRTLLRRAGSDRG